MTLSSSASVKFIFATILLDSVGLGLIIPILPDLIRRFSSDPVFISQYYGYFISSYALIQFLASPVLGSISDRFGRRPVLLTSLFGAGADYLVMAYAPNLAILFIGRIISGLTGASHTVASAYMADISDDSNRSANFGMIGAAFGIGFIIGPLLGGLLATIGPHACFIAAAAMNLANFLFGLFVLPESLAPEKRRHIELTRLNPFASLSIAFKSSAILPLIWVFVVFVFAGQVHPSTWTLYTQAKFGWDALHVGISFAVVGLAIAFVQGGLTRILIPKMGESRALFYGLVVNALSFAGFAFAPYGWVMYVVLVPSALAGIAGPAIQSMISREVPANEQGELQGTLMSLASLTAAIGPIVYTSLFAHFTSSEAPVQFPGAPYLGAAVIVLVSILILIQSRGLKSLVK